MKTFFGPFFSSRSEDLAQSLLSSDGSTEKGTSMQVTRSNFFFCHFCSKSSSQLQNMDHSRKKKTIYFELSTFFSHPNLRYECESHFDISIHENASFFSVSVSVSCQL